MKCVTWRHCDGICTLRVPNREVMRAFRELTALYIGAAEGSMAQMFRRLMEKDLEAFAGEYKRLLRTLPSYYDLKEENSYHMMMLGMCTFLTGEYDVESNRESGKGISSWNSSIYGTRRKICGNWRKRRWSRSSGRTMRRDCREK